MTSERVLPSATTREAVPWVSTSLSSLEDLSIDLSGEVLGDDTVRPSLLGRLPSKESPAETPEHKYDVRTEVGRGGMGKILEVVDNDLNRKVAMKVLITEEGRQGNLRRFVEEAQITGQLEHPNVLPVHDIGVNGDGELFFTMKYVKGHQNLREVIDGLMAGNPELHERFSFERRVQIVQQVCHALAYAHKRGVLHRDIKPDNIILGAFGEVFLVDWGVAKVLDPEKLPPRDVELGPHEQPVATVGSRAEFNATQEGSWVGTPAYMSPEQIVGRNSEVSARSDIYALSAVLYEFLCLHHYLEDRRNTANVSQLVATILTGKVRDAETYYSKRNGRVPRHLSRICRKGLRKRAKERWQTAEEMHTALQRWLEGRAPIVCPGTAIQSALSRWSAAIDTYPVAGPALTIGVGLLLVLGTVLGLLQLVLTLIGG